jgi:hypothetical protein
MLQPLHPLPLPIQIILTQLLTLLRLTKVDTDTVHTVPLILRVPKPLALENMPQMPTAVIAHNLRPSAIRSLANRVGHGVPERRPSAARVELVVRFVERRFARGARVDAGGRVVLVVFAGAGVLGTFLAEDAELLWVVLDDVPCVEVCVWGGLPGDSCVCHSPSVFCTG